jgi:nucleoside-diphosphate-sugar epimerase
MKSNSLVIVGCGDLGVRVGRLLLPQGYSIAGACRNPGRLPGDFTGYTADYCQPGGLDFLEDAAPDYVLATFKPSKFSPGGYQAGFPDAIRHLLDGLGSHRPRAIIMVSSTRVFAEKNGGWVDEGSALAQEGYAARAIVAAEQRLQNSGHKSCILRFGGIYGDPAGRLLSRIASGELCAANPQRYSNRIHRDDCAGFISHLIGLDGKSRLPVYIGVDNEPAPQHEVEQWLAGQLGVAGLSKPAAVDSPAVHKRCQNRLMRESGYTLQYPDFRAGYSAVLAREPESPRLQ